MVSEQRTLQRGPAPARRGGTVAIELLFALPIVLALLLAMFEFSMILVSWQQLVAASREGARVAALGGDAQEVEQAVRNFLGSSGRLTAAEVQSLLTDDQGQPLPAGGQVEVLVSVPTAQAVPDLLRFFGFSTEGELLVARTAMRKE